MGSCPACGGPLAAWIEVAAGEPADPRRYPLSRCTVCGTAVTGGPPPPPDAYTSGIYAYSSRRPAPIRALQRLTVVQPARILQRAGVATGGRVLDAGAGRGRLVAELHRRGFRAEGIEPSARSAAAARGSGLAVRPVALADHEDEGLDAVVLWHVLEHLDDPARALARAGSWLRPGGVALIGVPNVASLQARIGGASWMHFDAPRHRVHLTPRGLASLVQGAGLRPGAAAHMVWEHNPAAMWMALLSRAGMSPAYPFHVLKGNAPAGGRDMALMLAGLPLFAPAAALEAVAAAARRGGTIAALAYRPS